GNPIYTFANADWRVLKVDGDQALILKVNPLTELEAYGSGSTGSTNVPFLSEKAQGALSDGNITFNPDENIVGSRNQFYFDSDGSNGYQDSGLAAGYGLKAVIDYYYAHTLINYESKILTVNLHDPTLAKFQSGVLYNEWTWDPEWCVDTRFASTVDAIDGSQQAFALSYGDINNNLTVVDTGDGVYASLLDFPTDYAFWLRSAGDFYTNAGFVEKGIINCAENYVYGSRFVRPALWVKLD
ncbi:MAG: hypothetical protein LBS33_07340, partial [Streptococcaceae bacterium]|nr:hypothetical protein [Streptococcaceae bacterium]